MKKILLFLIIYKVSYSFSQTVTVSTFAGSGSAGSADATGTSASFSSPCGLVFDGSGNLYVADYDNNKIRKITAAGVVTTFAGSGTYGTLDNTGTSARFKTPYGIALDVNGDIIVCEESCVRKVTLGGVVTTLAGSGTLGSTDANGTSASFNYPDGLTTDNSGNIFVVDSWNQKIRKINTSADVTTFAGNGTTGSADGNGTSARFNYPDGIAIDNSGNMYVADGSNNIIRKITPAGDVTTFAGSGVASSTDGNGTSATFNFPSGIAIDGTGNLYVTEFLGNKVRKITPAGVVTTIAGTGSAGSTDGDGASATFNAPQGIAVLSSSELYVADYSGNKIRKILISAALPLEINYFKAFKVNGKITIKWKTEYEQEMSHFILQKSKDGLEYIDYDSVMPKGDSYNLKEYAIEDRTSLTDNAYYRLKLIDKDGNIEYSKTVSVESENNTEIKVFPNPSADYCYVNYWSENDSQVEITITDIVGRVVYQKYSSIIRGYNDISINIKDYPEGSYNLNFKGENQNAFLKFNKK